MSGHTDFLRYRLDSAWIDLDRRWPKPTRLYILWTNLTRHRPRLTLLGIGLGRLGLTSARADSARQRLKPTRLDISMNRLSSKSTRIESTQHRPGPARLTLVEGEGKWVSPLFAFMRGGGWGWEWVKNWGYLGFSYNLRERRM